MGWDLHNQGSVVVGMADSPCFSRGFGGKLMK